MVRKRSQDEARPGSSHPRRERGEHHAAGFEDPRALVEVADARGSRAARVRLAPALVVAEDAPSTIELERLGQTRQAQWDRREAEESLDCAKRRTSSPEREGAAVKRLQHAADACRDKERALAEGHAAVESADAAVAAERETYQALPASERMASAFGGHRRLEIGIVLVAVFDAVTLVKPLEASGLAQGAVLWVQIAAMAGAIWFATGVLGWLAGKITLSLRSERKRLGLAAFVMVGLALAAGFVMLGMARHEWTGQQNQALSAAAHDSVGVPTLLDPLWLTFLQIAVAGAAIVGVGMYVLAERGREGLARIAAAEAELAEARRKAGELAAQLEELRQARTEADVAINVVAAEGLEAGVESEIAARRWAAERAAEVTATQAAIARKNHMYWTEEKAYANGDCWVAQRPDRHRRMIGNPERVYSRAEAPPGRSKAAGSSNGHTRGRPDDVRRFVRGGKGRS